MPMDEIRKVSFIGGGTMGSFNATVSAMAGYDVTVYDISEAALMSIPERLNAWGEALTKSWGIRPGSVTAALKRVRLTADPAEAAKEADLISESVFESLDLKRQIHARFEGLCPPHTLITTNTSSILLSDIASAVIDGTRFAAMHYHQPTILVDLVAGPRTSQKTMDLLKRYVKSCGMTYVVLKKEKGGYLHNAMFGALLFSGMALAVMGMDFRVVDRSWIRNPNSGSGPFQAGSDKSGPFGLIDHVGLNLMLDILKDQQKGTEADAAVISMMDMLRERVVRGELGVKTGKGFYTYPDPEFSRPEFLDQGEENKDAGNYMVNAVLESAASLVAGGHGSIRDVDRSWMLTHNPKIGPFGMMDEKGLDLLLAELAQMPVGDGIQALERAETMAFIRSYVRRGELGVKTGKGFYAYPNPEFQKIDFLMND